MRFAVSIATLTAIVITRVWIAVPSEGFSAAAGFGEYRDCGQLPDWGSGRDEATGVGHDLRGDQAVNPQVNGVLVHSRREYRCETFIITWTVFEDRCEWQHVENDGSTPGTGHMERVCRPVAVGTDRRSETVCDWHDEDHYHEDGSYDPGPGIQVARWTRHA